MSKIWLIAMRELKAYFRTWMGYVIATAAILINGLLFNAFAVGNKPKFSSEVLFDFFYFSSGIAMVAAIFLAMRLFAEEKTDGTVVLFYTSPITERQLIYGKFLSGFIFFLILEILTLHLPLLILVQGKVSPGHLAAGYLGVILIGGATIAISLFASVVSPNQMVAGILGASITVVLLLMWILSTVVNPPLKDLFSYLAIHNQHFLPFGRGIVNSKDIIYYLSLVILFLECSIRAVEMRRLQG